MSTTTRKQAPRPAKPTGRYWKGKAPKGAAELSSSDSEDGDDERQAPEEEGDVAFAGEQDFLRAASHEDEEGNQGYKVQKTGKMSLALKNVNISKEGKVTISGKEDLGGPEMQELSETEEESDEKSASQEESDQSSEDDSESEEEKPKVQFRPVFIPKRSRVTVAEKQGLAEDSEEAIRNKQAEAEQRKKESHDLVAESIRRELLEKEKEEELVDVDDTDGLDPLGEFDAWRLRELARIKRDKEAEIAREEEREEIERRRALPEEQRMKEDLERAKKLREEKPKGKQVFLQKYWHKGAFHQDQDILKRHDFTEATESTMDVSLLPTVMQVKNFGKRGRTKYTHLLDQDTTVGSGSVKTGGAGTDGAGCFLCGGPHMKKDCPQNTGVLSGKPGTGPNAAPTGIRGERRSWRDNDDHRVQQAHGSDRRQREQRRSRSRSVDARAGDDKRRRLD
jgi:microfibrillar-associated protein 1